MQPNAYSAMCYARLLPNTSSNISKYRQTATLYMVRCYPIHGTLLSDAWYAATLYMVRCYPIHGTLLSDTLNHHRIRHVLSLYICSTMQYIPLHDTNTQYTPIHSNMIQYAQYYPIHSVLSNTLNTLQYTD